MLSLSVCKKGDLLLSKSGLVLKYVKKLGLHAYYDHEITYPDGSRGTRTDDGHVYRSEDKRLPDDHDVIKILSSEELDDPKYSFELKKRKMFDCCDALNNKIIEGALYGYTSSHSGWSYVVIGKAVKQISDKKCTLEMVPLKCAEFLYGVKQEEPLRKFIGKVSIRSELLFPMLTD